MELDEMDDTTLVLERFYSSSAERMFKAWTDPDDLRKWYSPVPGWVVSKAEVDLQLGGGYRIEFGPSGGPQVVEIGTYEQITPSRLLVVEIRIEGRSADELTRLKVEFESTAGGTMIRITESDYTNKKARDMHAEGWAHCLDLLEMLAG
ncbi:MAG TPA: SRPBCC domain-containing protein [Actinomycetota bacterium]|nr:SRPBCC domain-containing protein [Actinomycetota bacterium]